MAAVHTAAVLTVPLDTVEPTAGERVEAGKDTGTSAGTGAVNQAWALAGGTAVPLVHMRRGMGHRTGGTVPATGAENRDTDNRGEEGPRDRERPAAVEPPAAPAALPRLRGEPGSVRAPGLVRPPVARPSAAVSGLREGPPALARVEPSLRELEAWDRPPEPSWLLRAQLPDPRLEVRVVRPRPVADARAAPGPVLTARCRRRRVVGVRPPPGKDPAWVGLLSDPQAPARPEPAAGWSPRPRAVKSQERLRIESRSSCLRRSGSRRRDTRRSSGISSR